MRYEITYADLLVLRSNTLLRNLFCLGIASTQSLKVQLPVRPEIEDIHATLAPLALLRIALSSLTSSSTSCGVGPKKEPARCIARYAANANLRSLIKCLSKQVLEQYLASTRIGANSFPQFAQLISGNWRRIKLSNNGYPCVPNSRHRVPILLYYHT